MSPRTDSQTAGGQDVAAVHEQLRKAILYGELKAGETVPQGQLAADFGVGRTPLREALRLLQREGLVIAEPNRPVRIATLSAEDFEELYIMRITLEATAIRITVPTLTSDDFAELEGCMAMMDHYQRADDQAGLRGPHRTFHHRLVAASGTRVSEMIGELADHSERYRLSFGGFGKWEDRRAEHRGILDAATDSNPDLAAERLAIHYSRTAGLVFGEMDPKRDLSRLQIAIRAAAPGAESALSMT